MRTRYWIARAADPEGCEPVWGVRYRPYAAAGALASRPRVVIAKISDDATLVVSLAVGAHRDRHSIREYEPDHPSCVLEPLGRQGRPAPVAPEAGVGGVAFHVHRGHSEGGTWRSSAPPAGPAVAPRLPWADP